MLRGMWFDVEPSELSYTERSPFQIENEAYINASPDRVFDILATGEGQPGWFQDFVACRWTSPEPRGVGATREIELKMLTVKERFLAWERGRRLTFTLTGITIPLVRRMVEDMQFEPVGDRTRFSWRVHYTPSRLMRAAHPAARGVFARMFAASTSKLAAYAGDAAG